MLAGDEEKQAEERSGSLEQCNPPFVIKENKKDGIELLRIHIGVDELDSNAGNLGSIFQETSRPPVQQTRGKEVKMRPIDVDAAEEFFVTG